MHAEDKLPNPLDEVVNAEGATSLDRVLAQVPSLITDADLDAVIGTMRENRTRFQLAEERKRAKAEGVEDPVERESDNGTET